MIIACTSRFISDLSALTKKPKDRYFSCMNDIIGVFGNNTVENISKMGDALSRDVLPAGANFRKIRIPNSAQGIGASGGFRLLCVCFIQADSIVLLHVYPKTGSLGGENPQRADYQNYLREMQAENGNLYIFNHGTMGFEKAG